MLLNVIVFKNCKINAFTNPNFTDLEPDKAAKGLERALIANADSDPKLVASYESLDMFHIGTFDDETGIFTSVTPVLILSPREIVLKIKAEKLAQVSTEKVEIPEEVRA